MQKKASTLSAEEMENYAFPEAMKEAEHSGIPANESKSTESPPDLTCRNAAFLLCDTITVMSRWLYSCRN